MKIPTPDEALAAATEAVQPQVNTILDEIVHGIVKNYYGQSSMDIRLKSEVHSILAKNLVCAELLKNKWVASFVSDNKISLRKYVQSLSTEASNGDIREDWYGDARNNIYDQ